VTIGTINLEKCCTASVQDKCPAISNGILQLTKDIRLIKSELDALNKAKHDILLQQKESDDRR
jgi:hypothetical protein